MTIALVVAIILILAGVLANYLFQWWFVLILFGACSLLEYKIVHAKNAGIPDAFLGLALYIFLVSLGGGWAVFFLLEHGRTLIHYVSYIFK